MAFGDILSATTNYYIYLGQRKGTNKKRKD